MNVWIESPFDNLPQEGFRPQRFWLMAAAFAEAGHKVVYWTGDFSHASKAKRVFREAPENETARIILLPTLPYRTNVSFSRILSHWLYARTWRKKALSAVRSGVLEKPDVIISSMPTIGACEVAVKLAKKFSATAVIDVMDLWPDTFYRLLPESLRFLGPAVFWPLCRKVRSLYREANLVSGVCDCYGLTVRRLGAKRYHRAYHGIDLSDRRPGNERREEAPPFRLVYAGNMGRTYDLGTVIEAVARDANLELDIAGSGPMEHVWRDKAGHLKVADRVRFHGYLDEERLSRLLGSCHLGVVPMPPESFVAIPYKICDYLKAGLGVVSSLAGESGEILGGRHVLELYEVGSVQSLLDAVNRYRASTASGEKRDFDGVLALLDAKRIYREYVEEIVRVTREALRCPSDSNSP